MQVMGAWGYSRQNDALDKMEAILRRMETEYEDTLEADVRPNTVSYVTVSRSRSNAVWILVFFPWLCILATVFDRLGA